MRVPSFHCLVRVNVVRIGTCGATIGQWLLNECKLALWSSVSASVKCRVGWIERLIDAHFLVGGLVVDR